jgi:hypothetical protein
MMVITQYGYGQFKYLNTVTGGLKVKGKTFGQWRRRV